MKPNKIYNLRSLLEEKKRLMDAVKFQEQELSDRVGFFQSNYKSIIWESINPFKGEAMLNQVANLLIGEVLPAAIGVGTKSSAGMLLSKCVMKGAAILLKKIGAIKKKKASKEKR